MANKKNQDEARQDASQDELKAGSRKRTAKEKVPKGETQREGSVQAKSEVKGEKPEQKAEEKKEKKAESKTEVKAADGEGAKVEHTPREPQMVTVNGQKVSHAHAFQSNINPETWYFTAKLDGVPLRPMRMQAEDLAAYQKKEISVEQLMRTYFPSKLEPVVSREQYAADHYLSDGRAIDKMNVYKESDQNREGYGKYKLYAVVGDQKMSTIMSYADLNAFFDRTTTPAKLVEKNFGERLHLKSHYEQFKLPEGVEEKNVRVAKDKNTGQWSISVNLGERGSTVKKPISFDDGYSLFTAKTATRGQLAAKYLTPEIKGLLAAPHQEQAASIKR